LEETDSFCKTRGEFLHQWGEKDGYSVQGENLNLHAFVQGKLAFLLWELFVSPEFALLFALLSMLSSPFTSLEESTFWSILSWLF
jgi:hypothetical protein